MVRYDKVGWHSGGLVMATHTTPPSRCCPVLVGGARSLLPLGLAAGSLLAAGLALSACDTWTEGIALAPERPPVPYEAGSPWPKFRGNAMQNGRVDIQPS